MGTLNNLCPTGHLTNRSDFIIMHDIIIDIIVLPWSDDTHIRHLKLLSNKQPHQGANLTWISHDTLWVMAVSVNF